MCWNLRVIGKRGPLPPGRVSLKYPDESDLQELLTAPTLAVISAPAMGVSFPASEDALITAPCSVMRGLRPTLRTISSAVRPPAASAAHVIQIAILLLRLKAISANILRQFFTEMTGAVLSWVQVWRQTWLSTPWLRAVRCRFPASKAKLKRCSLAARRGGRLCRHAMPHRVKVFVLIC